MFNFLFAKQYRVAILLNIILVGVLFAYLTFFGKLSSKYTVYFFMAPVFLFVLFKVKSPLIKVAAPLFILIFTENIIVSRVPITPFFKVGGAFIFGSIVMLSIMWHQKKLKFPKYIMLSMFLFQLSAIIGVILGGSNEIFLNMNIEDYITYFIGFFIFFYIGYQVLEDPRLLFKIVVILLLFAFLTAFGQLFSILTGKNLELMRGQEMVASGRDLAEGQWRYGGFFGNVNSLSAFFVMTIPGCLLFLFSEKPTWIKAIAGLSMLSMLAATVFGASRGALLFVAVNLLISLFFFKVNMKQFFIGAFFIVILIVVVDSVFDQYVQEYVERAVEEMTKKGTDSPREVIWKHTIRIIQDYPLGVGLNSYNYMDKLIEYANLHWANPHNLYLHFLVQNGYLGFVAIMFLFIYTVVVNVKAYNKTKSPNYKLSLAFLLLMITGFLLMGLTEPLFRNQYKLDYIIGIVLGLSLSVSHRILHQNVETNADLLSVKA